MPQDKSRSTTIQQLARQLRQVEGSRSPSRNAEDVVSTGIAALDELLPERGLRRGTLVEWLARGEGSGAGTIAFSIARQIMRTEGLLLVIDPTRQFYPPAASRLGIDLDRTIVVRPGDLDDAVWSVEQSLGCPGVAAVVCWIESLTPRVFRRLRLAAEAGNGLGLLLRPAKFRSRPSWADVRFLVEPLPSNPPVRDRSPPRGRPEVPRKSDSRPPGKPPPSMWSSGRRVCLELLYCRGRMDGGSVELEISDETGLVRVAPRLASPTPPECAAGA